MKGRLFFLIFAVNTGLLLRPFVSSFPEIEIFSLQFYTCHSSKREGKKIVVMNQFCSLHHYYSKSLIQPEPTYSFSQFSHRYPWFSVFFSNFQNQWIINFRDCRNWLEDWNWVVVPKSTSDSLDFPIQRNFGIRIRSRSVLYRFSWVKKIM